MKILVKNKLNALIKRSYWYNKVIFPGCTKFWKHNTFNLDLVNLGSSAAYYAFCYSNTPLKCANFALAPQYLLADYEILRNYCSYIKPGGTVILGASLFFLDGYDVTYFDDRYYTILYPSSIWHYSYERSLKIRDVQKNPIKYFPLLSTYGELVKMFRKPKDSIPDDQFFSNAQRWMNNWKKTFSIDDFEQSLSLRNQDLMSQSIEIVLRIKNFCDNIGFNFIIVIPPVSIELRNMLTPQMRMHYFLSNNNPLLKEIPIFSYIDDKDFNDHLYFRNAYLLNERGAKLFTNKVLKDINIVKK